MKKMVALTLASAATFTQADILFTVTGGGNVWNTEASGYVDEVVKLDESGLNIESSNKMNFFATFEHPLPFLPNIKLANTNLELEGKGTADFSFQGEDFTGDTSTMIDLTHTDLTLFWGIPLPIPYLDINFGLTARNFSGGAEVKGIVVGSTGEITEEQDFNQILPMLYGNVRVGSPFGVYAYADINYIGYEDNKISDTAFALGYTLPVPVVDLNIEAGHRALNVTADIDSFDADIEVAGIFAGINVSFGF